MAQEVVAIMEKVVEVEERVEVMEVMVHGVVFDYDFGYNLVRDNFAIKKYI